MARATCRAADVPVRQPIASRLDGIDIQASKKLLPRQGEVACRRHDGGGGHATEVVAYLPSVTASPSRIAGSHMPPACARISGAKSNPALLCRGGIGLDVYPAYDLSKRRRAREPAGRPDRRRRRRVRAPAPSPPAPSATPAPRARAPCPRPSPGSRQSRCDRRAAAPSRRGSARASRPPDRRGPA